MPRASEEGRGGGNRSDEAVDECRNDTVDRVGGSKVSVRLLSGTLITAALGVFSCFLFTCA